MSMPNGQQTYAIAHPEVTAEKFDDEFVVLNLESGQYFSFSDGAALAWQGLATGICPDDLGAQISTESPARVAFETFVSAVIDAGLVREAEPSPRSNAGDLPGRIAASGDRFALEAFDDLAALLVADPIHDVEKEAGWPHNGLHDA